MLTCSDFNGQRIFLIDTQADISVIKESALNYDTSINSGDTITIKGVTSSKTESLGTTETTIILDEVDIPHTFHVVPSDFGIPSDGIIGKDFIKLHRCNLDYHSGTMNF